MNRQRGDCDAGATVVVVAYRPKPGKAAEWFQLSREHEPLRREEGWRPIGVVAARAAGDTVVEVFEWAVGGVEKAYANPRVLPLWKRYADACEIVPLASLAESSTMFAPFTPLEV